LADSSYIVYEHEVKPVTSVEDFKGIGQLVLFNSLSCYKLGEGGAQCSGTLRFGYNLVMISRWFAD